MIDEGLKAEIGRLLADSLRLAWCESDKRFIRIDSTISGMSPLSWLSLQSMDTQHYWKSRDHEFEVASIGRSYEIKAVDLDACFDEIQDILAVSSKSACFYGGVAFDQEVKQDSDWGPFKSFRFWVPRIELRTKSASCTLSVYIDREESDNLDQQLEKLEGYLSQIQWEAEKNMTPSQNGLSPRCLPNTEEWESLVQEVKTRMKETPLKKVVLARSVTVQNDMSALDLLSKLQNTGDPRYYFYFKFKEGIVSLAIHPNYYLR